MSVAKTTSSKRKLAHFSAVRELDRKALAIAARDGIALVDAYPKAFAELQRSEWAKEQR